MTKIKEFWIKNKSEILKNGLTVFITLAIVLGVFLYWSQYKVVWFCDEIYSYFTANSAYSVGPRIEYGKWYDSQFVIDDMTPECGKFFKRTIHNAYTNVHPPIYYLTLHVMSLFMRPSISKWVGLSVNLICLIGICILLYALLLMITRKKVISSMITIAVCILPSMITNQMLIRMYCMMTAWAMLYIFLAYILIQDINKKAKYALYILIACVTTCGFLTQYYFSTLAVGFTAAYAIYCITKRRWKDIILFGTSMASAVVAATIIWPRWITQVFSGYRGDAIIEKAFQLTQIFNNILAGIVRLSRLMFYDYYIIGIILVVVSLAFLIYKKDKDLPFMSMLLSASVFAGIIITHVTPDYIIDDRYFYMASAVGYVAIVLILVKAAGYIRIKNKNYMSYAVLAVLLMFNVYTAQYNEMSIGYIDRSGDFDRKREILKEYSEYPWIYYGYEDWSMMQNYYDLALGSRFIAYNEWVDFDKTKCPAEGEDFVILINTDFYTEDWEQEIILDKLRETECCEHEFEYMFNKGAIFYFVRHK